MKKETDDQVYFPNNLRCKKINRSLNQDRFLNLYISEKWPAESFYQRVCFRKYTICATPCFTLFICKQKIKQHTSKTYFQSATSNVDKSCIKMPDVVSVCKFDISCVLLCLYDSVRPICKRDVNF